MNIDKAKNALNAVSKKASTVSKKMHTPGIGWEIGAYSIRGVSVAVPAVVIMFLENSFVKSGLGLLATLLIVALLLIYKEPIKKAAGYAPGVLPFTIFIVLAIFFDTTAKSLFLIGSSGLGGSLLAIPFHLKYLNANKNEESEELKTLKTIAAKLK